MKINCATKVVCLRSHLIAFLTLVSPSDPQPRMRIEPNLSVDLFPSLGDQYIMDTHGNTHCHAGQQEHD